MKSDLSESQLNDFILQAEEEFKQLWLDSVSKWNGKLEKMDQDTDNLGAETLAEEYFNKANSTKTAVNTFSKSVELNLKKTQTGTLLERMDSFEKNLKEAAGVLENYHSAESYYSAAREASLSKRNSLNTEIQELLNLSKNMPTLKNSDPDRLVEKDLSRAVDLVKSNSLKQAIQIIENSKDRIFEEYLISKKTELKERKKNLSEKKPALNSSKESIQEEWLLYIDDLIRQERLEEAENNIIELESASEKAGLLGDSEADPEERVQIVQPSSTKTDFIKPPEIHTDSLKNNHKENSSEPPVNTSDVKETKIPLKEKDSVKTLTVTVNTVTEKKKRFPEKIKVKKGESLRSIAEAVFGKESLWKKIYKINRTKIKNPNFIKAGEILDLPKVK
ncbi:MAG TPA: LysM peptidoglycan-binding domain-containing protein [Leptospiraceae bacterium]|nr:LysM peptidoglycan-binding domain-containing protein [Leptospiraceae bacterium]HMY66649.1 LysM peptidoglycan-binding domain-containing protein [Leptospiraceae bacterium]HNF15766.1 LysM peptidoglycan-binding domain-containing protein [Leptospiraceae bacterium]HNF24280.1 LysM peptidoglycan-binding domain-containing protein [Leptospiraceae bacterium]HNI95005.1 LysM peptidoglycan-binding domain-containing protein [Leptospiraceae bacterium]